MRKKNAYLALGYACNERCRCCPLVHKNDREQIIPLERLLQEADRIALYGVTDVTLSGGEPTLHPDFFRLASYFLEKGIGVHVLSNGERFYDIAFSDAFISLSLKGELTVTTTFHSNDPLEHEYQNGSTGSFARSLKGIQYLDANGVQVSVKHCITYNNYRQLPSFIEFVLASFSPRVEIQLWGIDLYGLSEKLAKQTFVDFQLIRPYVQEAIDIFEATGRVRHQALTLNNLPLCMCNCYYWRYFTSPEEDSYIDHNRRGDALKSNSGPVSIHCQKCPFRSNCMGAYFSNFEMIGDEIVAVPDAETQVDQYRNNYRFYTEQSVKKTVFSPYLIHRLERNGYLMFNYLTGGDVLLRLKSDQILYLQKVLTDGISDEELLDCLDNFGLDSTAVVNELMRKGIIE